MADFFMFLIETAIRLQVIDTGLNSPPEVGPINAPSDPVEINTEIYASRRLQQIPAY